MERRTIELIGELKKGIPLKPCQATFLDPKCVPHNRGEDPSRGLLACPECGTEIMFTMQQLAGIAPIVCWGGKEPCEAMFFLRLKKNDPLEMIGILEIVPARFV